MRIGIVIDEVVVEFSKKFLSFFNEKQNKNASLEDLKTPYFENYFDISEEELKDLLKEFYFSDLFLELDLVDGAKENIEYLLENHEIFFITSRPVFIKSKTYSFLKNIFSDKEFKIFFSGDLWEGGKKKHEICKENKIEYMVEDNYDFALSCAQKGMKAILLEKPWNFHKDLTTNLFRVKDWREVIKKIEEEPK